MSSSFNGGFLGLGQLELYNSSAGGRWSARGFEKNRRDVINGNSASFPVSSPQELMDSGAQSGNYFFRPPGLSQSVNLYYSANLEDSKGWVRVFSSPFRGTATVNFVGFDIPWKGILVQRNDNSFRGYTYFSNAQLYNERTSTATSTGGNKSGYRIYIGRSGGHGIYNTSQNPCSWQNASGAIGAGYNGTCGDFPNDLVWGTGDGDPFYANTSGTWEHWIWWD